MSASLLTRNILKSSRMINNSVLCNIRMKSNTMITRTMASKPVSEPALPDSVHIAVVTHHIRLTKNDFLAHKLVASLTKEEQIRAWELFVEDITEEGFISIELTTEKTQIDRLIKEAVENVKAD